MLQPSSRRSEFGQSTHGRSLFLEAMKRCVSERRRLRGKERINRHEEAARAATGRSAATEKRARECLPASHSLRCKQHQRAFCSKCECFVNGGGLQALLFGNARRSADGATMMRLVPMADAAHAAMDYQIGLIRPDRRSEGFVC